MGPQGMRGLEMTHFHPALDKVRSNKHVPEEGIDNLRLSPSDQLVDRAQTTQG